MRCIYLTTQPIARAVNVVFAGINAFIVALLSFLLLMVFVNVVLRYGFGKGIIFTVEVSSYVFVWIVYLGIVLATLAGQHLSVNVLYFHLSKTFQKLLARVVLIIMIGLSGVFFVGSYEQMALNWDNYSPVSGIPLSVYYVAGCLSAGLMLLILLYHFWFNPQIVYQSSSQEVKEVA